MIFFRRITSVFLPIYFLILSIVASTIAADKPNIIIFMADDLGYADIGVNGCKDIPTPNIDAIANSGVRFTDGYAAHPVCSPSRAALMSGMYQHRFGFEYNSGPERFADPEFGLPREVPTLAEKLKTAGYATGMIGKWHLGFKQGLRPHERGFDDHFGFLGGARSYLPGRMDNDPIVRNGQPVRTTKYLTDEFNASRGRQNAPRIEETLKAADKNNDGKLSRDEYPQPRIFDAIDTDKDGFVTPDEVRTYYRNRNGG